MSRFRSASHLSSRRGSAVTVAKSVTSLSSAQLLGPSASTSTNSTTAPPLPPPVSGSQQLSGPAVNGTAAASTYSQTSSSSMRGKTPSLAVTGATIPSSTSTSPRTTLALLIDDLLLVTLLDDDHVPARVQLASLYKEKGDLALAEHWYERACKRSKSRGAGGGSKGLSTYYGGTTSHWGWESWAGLGKVLLETGRLEAAKDCLYFSVGIERVSPLRGFQCLRRAVN
jgi:TPR repeat protein